MRADSTYGGRLYRLWHDGEMVQTLFHEQPDDAIGVKEKVPAVGRSVSDDRVQGFELSGPGKRKHGRRQRCWGCLRGCSCAHRRCDRLECVPA